MTESDHKVKFTKKELRKANNKSIEKFQKAKKLIEKLESWIYNSYSCGYCILAYKKQIEYNKKAEKSEKRLSGCLNFCYPPARQICRKYITGNNTVYDYLTRLTKDIDSLLYDLNELEVYLID